MGKNTGKVREFCQSGKVGTMVDSFCSGGSKCKLNPKFVFSYFQRGRLGQIPGFLPPANEVAGTFLHLSVIQFTGGGGGGVLPSHNAMGQADPPQKADRPRYNQPAANDEVFNVLPH